MYFRYIFLIILVGLFSLSSVQAQTYKVGLRAYNGIEKGVEQWWPTIDYLNQTIEDHNFELIPIVDLKELNEAAANGEFDFVLTNPSSYVEIEVKYGASRILTMLNKGQDRDGYDKFGSVLFSLSSNEEIKSERDFKGKRIIAVSERAFGGWRVAQKEMLDVGVDPYKTFSTIAYADGIQEDVVYAVLNEQADVGVVRTDMLERMADDGKIDLNDFRILMPKTSKGFHYHHSTFLYPEWTFSRLPSTPLSVAKEVAITLLEMPSDNVAAIQGKYLGWTVPKDYGSVHDLLKMLKIEPYERYGEISLKQAIITYKNWLLAALGLFALLMFFTMYIIKTNRTLEKTRLQLVNAHDQLEEKVKERTSELEDEIERRNRVEEKLIYSRNEAERANQAKSEIISAMSHELRTPLSAIVGYTQLVQHGPGSGKLDKQQSEYLEEVADAGEHLTNLITEILDLEKIESGKMDVDTQELDLMSLIKQCQTMLSKPAMKKAIQFNIDLPSTLKFRLKGDPLRMKQVLLNIISNAIKYNRDNGSVSISVVQEKDETCISIIDTGVGIDSEDMNRLFQPFGRIVQRDYFVEGTGIGLFVSKKLVELMNGRIDVKSQVGVGSTFSLCFPNN